MRELFARSATEEPLMLPLRLVPMLMLIVGGASPLLAQGIERPPTGYRSPTVVPAGPSWMKVTALVPTRLDLKWAAVANAGLYGILRSSTSDPTEKLLLEIPAGTGDQDLTDDYYYYFDNLPPRSGGVTFSYKAYAVFLGTDGSRTQSTPSPTFAVQALTPIAPPKLKSKVTVSQLMGRLRVTLDWGAVDKATGYQVFQITRPPTPPLPMLATTVRNTSFTIDNVVPGQGGTVCVVTVYEEFLKDDTVRSCDLVATRAP
jgi:hypothetical protein